MPNFIQPDLFDKEKISTADIAGLLSTKYRSMVKFIEKHNILVGEKRLYKKTGGRPTPFWNVNTEQAMLIVSLCKNSEQKILAIKALFSGGITGLKALIPTSVKSGHVYCLYANEKTKVGRTINLGTRIQCILTQAGINKADSRTWYTEKIPGYQKVEVEAIRFLSKEYIRRGEWFDCKIDVAINAVKRFL